MLIHLNHLTLPFPRIQLPRCWVRIRGCYCDYFKNRYTNHRRTLPDFSLSGCSSLTLRLPAPRPCEPSKRMGHTCKHVETYRMPFMVIVQTFEVLRMNIIHNDMPQTKTSLNFSMQKNPNLSLSKRHFYTF